MEKDLRNFLKLIFLKSHKRTIYSSLFFGQPGVSPYRNSYSGLSSHLTADRDVERLIIWRICDGHKAGLEMACLLCSYGTFCSQKRLMKEIGL